MTGNSSGSFDYTGGSGSDLVEYNAAGSPSDVAADFGDGADTFHLMSNAEVSAIAIDFGNGADVFTNDLGSLDVQTSLLGVGGFAHVYNPGTDTLRSVQRSSSDVRITFDNNGMNNAFRVNVGTVAVFGEVSNLDITLLDDSEDTLFLDFDNWTDQASNALDGNLAVDLGDGDRTVNFIGDNNSIGGTFDLTGGAGVQDVRLGVGGSFNVGSATTIDLATGADRLSTGGNANFGGDVVLNHVNEINMPENDTINGNLDVDNSGESNAATLNVVMSDMAGSLRYTGGDGGDTINLSATTTVEGDIDRRPGAGANTASINMIFGGSSIRYTGGSGADQVTLGSTGNDAVVNAKLGTGDDSFVLREDAAIATDSLRVDFGGGDDRFTSDYGQFDFNARLLNLDGYNAFFDVASGNIDITQVADTGNVRIDNNGPLSTVRFGSGTLINNLTPANDIRLILMDNTSTNVTADFDSVRNGNTTIQLKSGERNVRLTGESNVYNGLLRLEAADGVQSVQLALNADLNVTGTLVVNTRDASDTVVAENAIDVSGAMLLRGVNTFVNDNGVDVGGDFM